MNLKPTEWEVVRCLCLERYSRNFCLPRFTPLKWWECDLFELTKAGYFREYEIKLTRADFIADREKEAESLVELDGRWSMTKRKKHQEMGMGFGPVQFWYVTPEGMITANEVPSWAGWISFQWRPGNTIRTIREIEVKPAPRLHQTKACAKVVAQAQSSCYWRMHSLIQRREFDPTEEMPEPEQP